MRDLTLTRRSFTALSLASVLGAVAAGRAPALAGGTSPTVAIEGRAFATTWSVRLPAGSRAAAGLRPLIENALARVDRQMSPWRPDSNISRFNRAGAGRHHLPPETCGVIRAALGVAGASGGAFDPTVGPLVRRAGYGPIDGSLTPDWHGLLAEEDSVRKARPGLTVDLCGIAKGHALDRIAAILRDAGEEDFLIEIGGELLAGGRHPSGRAWRAGVENPLPGSRGLAADLRLGTHGVATSGLRWNATGAGLRRHGHIVDPSRRAPASGALASVTVLHETAALADAWSTALFATGAEEGPGLARSAGISALFLARSGGGLVATTTGTVDANILI